MKKLIIAAIALTGFSVASFAQAVPAKKADASKMQIVKNTSPKKVDAKVVAINNVTKPAPAAVTKTPVVKTETKAVVAKTTPVAAKPVAVTKPVAVAKINTAAPLKKDGTPDKRFKTNTGVTAGPLKKDGTADMRFKANKKH